MSWAFQPLLPASVQQQSGPQTHNVGVSESCSAADTKTGSVPYASAITEGGVPSSPNVGYLAGASGSFPPYSKSNVGRFRFDTETFGQSSALLSPWKRNAVGFGAATKGYMVGGYDNSDFVSGIQSLVFATEACLPLGASLAIPSSFCAGVSSSARGYVCDGGGTSPPTGTVEGFRFDTEAVVTVSATLNVPRWFGAGVSSSARGYIAGDDYAGTNAIDGLRFDTEAAITTSATISTTDPGRLNTASSSTRGYWCGGVYDATDTTPDSLGVDAIRYDTEAAVNPSSTLASPHISGAGLSSSVYGYIIGGDTELSVDKLLFSSETTASLAGVLGETWQSPCGFQGARASAYDLAELVSTATATAVGSANDAPACASSADKQVAFYAGPAVTNRGYFCGGYDGGSNISTIRVLDYQTEGATTAGIALNTATRQAGGAASDFKGYIAGGVSALTRIEAIQFADQTRAVLSAVLPTGIGKQGSTESDLAGYFSGGDTGSYSNVLHKILFSTEATSTPSATLSANRLAPAGASSATKGYVAGGEEVGGTEVTTNEAITFSTDAIATLGAVLSTARAALAGVPSGTSAYWCGGFTLSSTYDNSISRLQFSNETSVAVTATLASGRSMMGAVNSSSKGYLGGGLNGSYLSAILALTFSGETTASLAATMSTTVGGATGISYNAGGTDASTGSQATSGQALVTNVAITEANQQEKSFVCGGYNGGYYAMIDVMRAAVDVFNNTGVSLSSARGDMSAGMTSPQGEGYLCGGSNSGPYVNSIEGVSLYSETTHSLAAVLSGNRGAIAGVSSATNGYTMGGVESLDVSTIDRLSFGTETLATLSATLPVVNASQTAVSSSTKGYALGGYDFPSVYASAVALTFSTEATATLSAVLSVARYAGSGLSSSTAGYCANGMGASAVQNVVDKLTYSSEVMSTTAVMPTYRRYAAGISSSLAGYSCSGNNTGSALTTIGKLLFATDATSSSSGSIATGRTSPTGLSYPSAYPAKEAANATASGSSPGIAEESANGTDAANGIATMYGAHTASATAAASHDATALFVSAISNAASAAEAISATAGFASSIAESGSAADAKTLSYLAVATITEAVTSSATHDGTVYTLLSVGVTEAATAQDLPAAVMATAAAIISAAAAAATADGQNAIGGAAQGSTTATAAQDALNAAVASSSESSTLVDTATGGLEYTSAASDAAAASNAQSAQRDSARGVSESASATATPSARSTIVTTVLAGADGQATPSAVLAAVAAKTESAAATSAATTHAFFVVDYTGVAAAADILSAVSNLPVLVNEQAHAVDFVVVAPWGDLLPGAVRVYVGYRQDIVVAGAKSMLVATGEESAIAASGEQSEVKPAGEKQQIAHTADELGSIATTGKESGKVSSGR